MKPVKVGIVGCGNISDIYFMNLNAYPMTEVAACADLVLEAAQRKAEAHKVPKVCSVDELMANREIEIVVNLTVPKAHAEIAFKALEAGKSVHGEKPLAVTREDGRKILELAAKKKLLVGAAPDTFLGGGIQTCRKLIDEGWIGRPVSATAFMMCPGHEYWHPSPEFYYEVGGGPMFDMGPYYLSALINLMGPVAGVSGETGSAFEERTIRSQPKCGKKVKVETPTHVAGLMNFANGAIGTIITSFDVWGHSLPCIEVHGTLGSLSVPDPNGFGGPVKIRRPALGQTNWVDVPLAFGYQDNARGLGVADMACALRSGRKHRANGELAYHVLDLMHAFHDAAKQGKRVSISSTCERPAPMPMGLWQGELD